jgi:signal transduction histidine kinase
MQMQNAFKNLIDNSIKYTPSGSVDVTLTKTGTTIRFEIKDTGVGITPEDMKNLFTEGGHGKESAKVNVESTGFGLFIVKNIIEAHKGKVWAESEGAGKGSKFIVELPA